jgi:hypothetical protein
MAKKEKTPERLAELAELRKFGEAARAADPRLEAFRIRAIAETEKYNAEQAAAKAAASKEDGAALPPVVHEADTSYAQVRQRVLGTGQPGQLRDWAQRRKQPKPPPENAQVVVNGLTGERHIVPAGVHQAPTAPLKNTRKPVWCSACLRKLAAQEVKELQQLVKTRKLKSQFEDVVKLHHKHDPTILITKRHAAQGFQVGDGKAPRQLNSNHKPVRPRKQASRFQGMAGRWPQNEVR